jgi:hypothetical protein
MVAVATSGLKLYRAIVVEPLAPAVRSSITTRSIVYPTTEGAGGFFGPLVTSFFTSRAVTACGRSDRRLGVDLGDDRHGARLVDAGGLCLLSSPVLVKRLDDGGPTNSA